MSVTIVLTPPAALLNANDRMHHHPKAKLTRAWREAACAAVESGFHPFRFERAHVTCIIRFADNIRRDVGNFYPTAKACLDGIVDAGVLEDDSDLHILGPDMRREWPNGEPRVTLTVEPIGEAQ